MPGWYSRLRVVVWPAVIAAVLAACSVLLATRPDPSVELVLATGLAATTSALLATRE